MSTLMRDASGAENERRGNDSSARRENRGPPPVAGLVRQNTGDDRATLGVAMGFQGAVLMLAGSIGPVVTGVLSDQTGDRRWAAVLAASAGVIAATFILRSRSVTHERRHPQPLDM